MCIVVTYMELLEAFIEQGGTKSPRDPFVVPLDRYPVPFVIDDFLGIESKSVTAFHHSCNSRLFGAKAQNSDFGNKEANRA